MIAVLSRFTVVNGMAEAVKEAFRRRPHLVDDAPGFIALEILSPKDDPNEIWLLTHWQDEPSYHAWHRSHARHEAHKGIPKGLKLDPSRTRLLMLTHICS